MSSQTEFIVKGATDVTIDVMLLQDNSGTNPGDPLTGLVYNSTNLVCYYREGGTGAVTQLTLATQTVTGAHSDGGFVELSSSNMPGMYRLDLSDTIVSGSNNKATVVISGYADLAPHFINIVLLDFNIQSSTVSVGTGGITSSSFASGAIDAAAIAANAIGASELASDAIGSDQLAASAATELFGHVIESQGSYTVQQALSIMLSVLAGVTSSGGDVIATPNGSATRVTATIDGSNNRTAMTLTPSS